MCIIYGMHLYKMKKKRAHQFENGNKTKIKIHFSAMLFFFSPSISLEMCVISLFAIRMFFYLN